MEALTHESIFYQGDSKDLRIELFFEDKREGEDFQTAVMEIPYHYRKRKLPSHLLCDITVVDGGLTRERSEVNLRRLFSHEYMKLHDDSTPSEDCDGMSETNDSYVSSVYLTETVKLQLLDKLESTIMYKSKPEKCHLKSKSKFPNDALNPNNILYMSRFLHEHFDGINKVNNCPTFIIKYMSYHEQALQMVLDGRDVVVYETTVRVIFKTVDDKATLCVFFRPYSVVNDVNIELTLYFENPNQFKRFCDYKELMTMRLWEQIGEDD